MSAETLPAQRKPALNPAPKPPINWVGVTSNVLLAIAVLIVMYVGYIFGVSRLIETRSQHALGQQLASPTASAAGRSAFHGEVPNDGNAVAVLSIPSIGVRDFVVEGTTSSDLEKGPGLLEGAAPPGVGGDTVIEGRRHAFGAPFGSLPSLRTGSDVQLTSALGQFTYRVLGSNVLGPGSVDPITAAPNGMLTLVTSTSSLFPRDSFVVQASLVGSPVAADASAPPPDATLGLSGDPVAGLGTYVSGQLLILLVIGLALLRRRRRLVDPTSSLPLMTWVLATPVVLALILVFFGELTKLLPATM